MKSMTSFVLAFLFVASASAQDKRVDAADIDSLGGNEGVIRMAKALDPQNRARIVQKRTVNRNMRLEIGLGYGGTLSGDPYMRTQNLGLQAELHLTPRWSLGVRYLDHSNSLTPEGQRVFDQAARDYAAGGRSYVTPDIDPALQSAFATVSWYPMYGKTNLLDVAIAQFDLYLMGGMGQIQLEQTGWTTLSTAGIGVGLWVNRNWSVRTELRMQNYKDTNVDESRNMTTSVAGITLGYLL